MASSVEKVAKLVVHELPAGQIAHFLHGFHAGFDANGNGCGSGCGAGCVNARGVVLDPEGTFIKQEDLHAAVKDRAALKQAIVQEFSRSLG